MIHITSQRCQYPSVHVDLEDLASFGASAYDHGDATGFINLFGLSTGVAAIVHRNIMEDTGQAPSIKEMAAFHEK